MYEVSYGNETHDTTVTSPSTLSVSAPQDAESPAGLPQGTVAHGSESAAAGGPGGHVPEVSAHEPAAAPHAQLPSATPPPAGPHTSRKNPTAEQQGAARPPAGASSS